MGRTWTIRDFDPKTDPMMDCSTAESAADGFADEQALDGVEESD